MRISVLLAVFAASATPALAAGYDDFSRGLQANVAGNSVGAIAAFTSALNAGDLATTYVPDAYYGRALAYARSNNCAAALTDTNTSIKLRPREFEAHLLRVQLDDCLGNDDAQARDIAAALEVKPSSFLFMARGQLKWRKADFAGASGDFLSAYKLQPADVVFHLWSAAALMHEGTFDPAGFAKSTSDVRLHGWPEPLFDLYAGETKPEAVLAVVAKEEDATRKNRICLANFFIAEWHLWRHETEAARAMLQEASGCNGMYFVRRAARYDFARLK